MVGGEIILIKRWKVHNFDDPFCYDWEPHDVKIIQVRNGDDNGRTVEQKTDIKATE